MGTRGIFGVTVNGKDKLMYNHFDSYPSGLGLDILNQTSKLIREKGLDWFKEQAESLKMVDGSAKPTQQEKKKLIPYTDLEVGERSENDWYCLTRMLQGKLDSILEVGIGVDGSGFIRDSLFCEWGYIVNLDNETLEVYKGFQEKPHNKGRFAKLSILEDYRDDPYYPCALVSEFPLDKLPSEAEFLKAVKEEE